MLVSEVNLNGWKILKRSTNIMDKNRCSGSSKNDLTKTSTRQSNKVHVIPSVKHREINIPENWWLEVEFPFGFRLIFRGELLVSGSVSLELKPALGALRVVQGNESPHGSRSALRRSGSSTAGCFGGSSSVPARAPRDKEAKLRIEMIRWSWWFLVFSRSDFEAPGVSSQNCCIEL